MNNMTLSKQSVTEAQITSWMFLNISKGYNANFKLNVIVLTNATFKQFPFVDYYKLILLANDLLKNLDV